MSNKEPKEHDGAETANGSAQPAGSGLDQLKADLEKAKNDYLYLAADFDNYRKNAIKERSDLVKFGSERLVRDLLNVVDNFERAVESNADPDKFREGIQMIHTELKSLLQRFGVTEVAAHGSPFDPSTHEALSSEPTNDVPVGHVARVFKKAYKLHDRLIRPAQVVVAVKPESNEKPS